MERPQSYTHHYTNAVVAAAWVSPAVVADAVDAANPKDSWTFYPSSLSTSADLRFHLLQRKLYRFRFDLRVDCPLLYGFQQKPSTFLYRLSTVSFISE